MLRLLVCTCVAATCCMASAATLQVQVEPVDSAGRTVSGTSCDIVNREGRWQVSPPALAAITPAGNWLQIKCSKGAELTGTSTSIDTTLMAPRRSGALLPSAEPGGVTAPARVRVVLRGTGSGSDTQIRVAQTASAARLSALTDAAATPSHISAGAAPSKAPQASVTPVPAAPSPQLDVVQATATPAAPSAVPESAIHTVPVSRAAAPAVPVPVPPPAPATATAPLPQPAPRDVYDAGQVPFVPPEGKVAYRQFLAYPLPRAFAVSRTGTWGWAVRGQDAARMALANCERRGGPCELYTVDKQVVWAGRP